jgi:aminopeptidase-like protein
MTQVLKALAVKLLKEAQQKYVDRVPLTYPEQYGVAAYFYWAANQSETIEEGVVLTFIGDSFKNSRPLTSTYRDIALAYLEYNLECVNEDVYIRRELDFNSAFAKH